MWSICVIFTYFHILTVSTHGCDAQHFFFLVLSEETSKKAAEREGCNDARVDLGPRRCLWTPPLLLGFPFPGKELTKDYNPLEAGLWHSVHFDKVLSGNRYSPHLVR